MTEGFKMVPVDELPTKAAGGRRSIYAEAVQQFLNSGAEVARLEFPDKSAKTVQIGLITALNTLGTEEVKVSIRHGLVYLHRMRD